MLNHLVGLIGYSQEMQIKLTTLLLDEGRFLPQGRNLFFWLLTIALIQLGVFLFSAFRIGTFGLFAFLMLYPIANYFIEMVSLRRFFFMVIILPSVPSLYGSLKYYADEMEAGPLFSRTLKSLSAVALLMFVIPGFYLPPFFDGIAGWSMKPDTNNFYTGGLRIRFKDDTTTWFKPSLFSPLTQISRAERSIKRRDPVYWKEDFGCMLLQLYKKGYPHLSNGRLPTQAILGDFSYHPHSLDKLKATEVYFPVSEIKQFERAFIFYVNEERSTELAPIDKVEERITNTIAGISPPYKWTDLEDGYSRLEVVDKTWDKLVNCDLSQAYALPGSLPFHLSADYHQINN